MEGLLNYEKEYAAGVTYTQMLEQAVANREMWQSLHDRAVVPAETIAEVNALPGRWRLLVISEDWCGDAFNTVPYIARLAEAADNLELRIIGRDANPHVIDAHLTRGSRSIPVAILLDENGNERAWWGPRPAPLQEWFYETGRQMPPTERYREMRRWYVLDKGLTTLSEVVGMLRGAALEIEQQQVG